MANPQNLELPQARKLADEILVYVSSAETAHWASFFDSDPALYGPFCQVLAEDDYCQEQINSARALLGRRVMNHAIFNKCTPLHKDLVRWYMDDFNEFLHQTNKREYEDRALSETQAGNAALEKISELLAVPHAEC